MNRENAKHYKVAIIGGGVSGLISSIEIAKAFGGENVVVFEKLNRVGKKILSTGNGRCNLTNANVNLTHFHGENPLFCVKALKQYDNNYLINYFKSLGVYCVLEGDKYYPNSMQASSVLDALRFKIDSLKVNVFTDTEIIGINKENFFTLISSSGQKYYADNVIVSVGGKSAKHFGTDGSSYKLCETFGHKTTKLYPSLVQIKCDVSNLKGLKGLKQQVKAYAVIDGKIVAEKLGDILFTDYGVSGNTAFYLSSYIVGKNASILIDFCPSLSKEELYSFLKQKQVNCPYVKVEDFLSGILNGKIGGAIIKSVFSSKNLTVEKLDLNKLCTAVKNYKVNVLGTLGFDDSQVTRGGLDTCDFDDSTMQSKLVKNLYAVGEVLDIDGDCGGYNIQWAFSSACLASNSILNQK